MKHLYWGPEYSNDLIVKALHESKLHYRKSKNICNGIGKLVLNNGYASINATKILMV